jgi:hypothetical protein
MCAADEINVTAMDLMAMLKARNGWSDVEMEAVYERVKRHRASSWESGLLNCERRNHRLCDDVAHSSTNLPRSLSIDQDRKRRRKLCPSNGSPPGETLAVTFSRTVSSTLI